ncbi:MAG: DUF1302 family protein [Telluria sp.]|nr:DUF1302 family protein [Telluria sp.]
MNTQVRKTRAIGCGLHRIAALVACATVGSAHGIEIKTDNPDITASWSNTVRYNLGARVEKRDPVIGNTLANDESEFSYDRGQIVTNRLDLLSEFDFDYKKQVGLRVSGAAWYDKAFNADVHTNPALVNAGSYKNNRFSDFTRRYYQGLSGEFLDAYVYANFNVGSLPASVKAGRHAVLWGEALSLSNHSVSYNQTPGDGRKGIANPGITAKEAALPIGQISGTLLLTPQLSLAGQYFYEWKPSRAPEGGTYLGVVDFILQGPDRFCLAAAGPCLANAGMIEPKRSGDWGLSARWNPDWLGATLGVYARQFDERNPWTTVSPPTGTYRFSFAQNTKLYGISLSKNIGGVSIGAELLTRRDTALQAASTDASFQGPRGNTTHALLNGVAQFGTTPLWSSSVLTAELAYSRWNTLTSNPTRFNSCDNKPVGQRDVSFGCSTKDNWVSALSFSPTWTAVVPGLDITAATRVNYGIKGNTAVLSNSSGRERVGAYSVSTAFDYNQKHTFTIAYNDYIATYRANPAGTAIAASNGDQLQDRGWLVFTYATSF